MSPAANLPELLHRVFGHRSFRPHQQQVCEAAAAGRDVLLVMPTGAGKSLCYQLPALARSHPQHGGTALVISPLIALMDDQSAKLEALGLRVARIHSGLTRDQSRQACRDYLDGTLDFLFIAPERMRVPGFPEMLTKRKPSLVAIDEAHCISQWGHDFRPDYRTLGQHLPALRPAPIVALTATATPTVQRDIAAQLNLADPAVFITGFRRANLAIEVHELSKPQRADFALKLLKDSAARPAIIYAGSRKDATELAEKLHKHFPTAAYHAGLDAQTRDRVQRAFLSSKLDVVVATVAFGMGIDKADVRTVLHVALPSSVEAYYQEIGRAGRDGQPSRTILLHGFADRRLQDFLLERNYPPTADLERVLAVLSADYTTINAVHNALLHNKDTMDRETLDRSIEKLLAANLAQMDINGDVRLAEPATNPVQTSGGPSMTTVSSSTWMGSHNAHPTTWQSLYDHQVSARRAQIDRMIAFAESTTCRMASLIAHFGDATDTRRDCGLCDICNPSANAGSAAHQPDQEESRALRTILRALEGRGTSTGKLFTDLKLTKDRSDFDLYLDGLARAGLITLANDTFTTPEGKSITYKKAAITPEGRDPDDRALATVWLRTPNAPTARTKSKKSGNTTRTTTNSATLDPGAEALFDALRTWRTETARPTKTPAFMILSDAVLRAIANTRPQNLAALNAIPGIGPSKVDKFGAALIALCRQTSARTPTPSSTQPREAQTPGAPQPALSKPRGLDSEAWVSTDARSGKNAPTSMSSPQQLSGGPSFAASSQRVGSHKAHPVPTPKAAPQKQSQIPPTELTPAQQALDTRLRAWRKQAAAAAGLPSFFILSDTALASILAVHPRTPDDLRTLRGLDPEKLTRFGADILACCNA